MRLVNRLAQMLLMGPVSPEHLAVHQLYIRTQPHFGHWHIRNQIHSFEPFGCSRSRLGFGLPWLFTPSPPPLGDLGR